MILIIAEKPSLARNIVSAIGTMKRNDGYYSNQNYLVTWAFGHLFSLVDIEEYDQNESPNTKWKMDNLPCFPKVFKFDLRKDSTKKIDAGVQKQFNIIKLSEALLFGFLLYYAISYLFSFLTCSHFQKPLSFISRLFFSALLIHFSLPICEKVIDFFYLISSILRTIGLYIFPFELSFSILYEKISKLFFANLTLPFKFFSFDGILKSFLSFGFYKVYFY